MEIYKKIFAVRNEVGKLSKTETNPFFKSKYFDINGLIENVRPLFEKQKLLLLQPIISNCVVSQIIDIDSGEKVESSIELPTSIDPQKIGSAITYYRRYTLQSLLGLETEDDDGNKAATPPKPQPVKQEKPSLTDEQFGKALATLKGTFPITLNKVTHKTATDLAITLQNGYLITSEQQIIINETLNKK